MAVHLSLTPAGMNDSLLYEWCIIRFEKGEDQWDTDYLLQKFHPQEIQSMINRGYLVKVRNEHLKLGFRVIGTLSFNVTKFADRSMLYFSELLSKLPKNARCSGNKLRDCLIFLMNFGQIQTFTLPVWAITCIAADDQKFEPSLDRLYTWGQHVESKYLYRVDVNEGLNEWKSNYEANLSDSQSVPES